MNKQQIKDMPEKEFREWMKKLAKEWKYKELSAICRVKLSGGTDEKEIRNKKAGQTVQPDYKKETLRGLQ